MFFWKRYSTLIPKCLRSRRRQFLFLLMTSLMICVVWCTVLASKTVSSRVWRSRNITEQLSTIFEQLTHDCINYSSKIPFHEFVTNQPRSVVLLSYQRSGSSIFGQLFNRNPSAFHTFEPLDSLYGSMYGIRHRTAVPSDIVTHWNGQPRTVPENEIREQSNFLAHLLNCELDLMPTDFLIHSFWWIFPHQFAVSTAYIDCLTKWQMQPKYNNCESLNPFYCGERFGEKHESQLHICHGMLTNDTYQPHNVPVKTREMYAKYRSCMTELRRNIDNVCTPLLATSCKRSEISSTKTVRASMASMEALLEAMPNFRVIHLVRDPRAVVLSRRDSGNIRHSSTFSNTQNQSNFLVSEASIYCRTIVDDIKIRRRLEQLYPGRIYPVVYEEVVENLEQAAENVYYFLNVTISLKLRVWLKKSHVNRGENATTIASKWTRKLTAEQNNNIVKVCRELFQFVNYKLDIA